MTIDDSEFEDIADAFLDGDMPIFGHGVCVGREGERVLVIMGRGGKERRFVVSKAGEGIYSFAPYRD